MPIVNGKTDELLSFHRLIVLILIDALGETK
jgi:hypothetical protein